MARLEFDAVRRMLADHVSCALGRRLALKIMPVARRDLVERWQRQVAEMIEAAAGPGLPPFGGVHDIRELVRSAVPPHCLEPDDLAVLADTFTATHQVVEWAASLPPHLAELRGLCVRVGDFEALAKAIRRVVDASGRIRDDASARLSRLRTEIGRARVAIGLVVDRLLRERQVTRWLRYPEATFHDDRLVLPLAAEHRGRLPGIVHRSSDSGATLFVEPAEAVELNNRIVALRQDEREEINRLLWHLTHQVYLNQAEILATLDALAVLDLVAAKVRFARALDMHCPEISADGSLNLRQARHPLLADLARQARAAGEDRQVVPISVRLGEDFDVLVITGPNTGGKTAALKTIGLLCLMAQAGLPIPAQAGSRVPVYSDVLVDVGDEQSLQQSLSTFSAHLAQLLVMLKRARSDTLVLIDELGAGTDPDEGAALGRAILEELLERHCPAVITTHLGVLKTVAYSAPRAQNACVDFDARTLRPTYHLLIGEPGNSNAINIAARLGLPDKIVRAARGYLSRAHEELARAIRGTLQSRRQAERAREASEALQDQARQQIEAAERERRTLQEKQADFDRWVAMIAALRPGDTVHVRRFDRPGRVVRMMLHKQLAVVAVGAVEMEVPIREILPPPAGN